MDLIKLLIAEGADLEAVSTKYLQTPLHQAVQSINLVIGKSPSFWSLDMEQI